MNDLGWRERLNQFKFPIGLAVVGMVLIIGGMFASGLNKSVSWRTKDFPKESLIDSQKMISVDVSGAVAKPGVYKLKDGSRIEDAILAAGGFMETANQEYVSKYLNMAQKVSDGSKIYVPPAGDQGIVSQGSNVAGTNVQAKVNINTATQAELEALSGIAATRASNIISGRPYGSVEDLLSKKILTKSVFDKIKDQLVVY